MFVCEDPSVIAAVLLERLGVKTGHSVEFLYGLYKPSGWPFCFLGEGREGERSSCCCGQRYLEADATVGWGKAASSAVN